MEFSHNDELFERMVAKTIFSFKTNKKIFRSVLTLHKLKNWKTVMEKVHEASRFKLTDESIEDYRSLAIESVVTFLKNPEKAPCTRVDPTGADKLLYAKEMRHELRHLTQKKIITLEQANGFLVQAKAALRDNIYKHGELPTVADIL